MEFSSGRELPAHRFNNGDRLFLDAREKRCLTLRLVAASICLVLAFGANAAAPRVIGSRFAWGGAHLRFLTSAVPDDRDDVVVAQSLWVRPPGARKEVAVDLREASFVTGEWHPGTRILAQQVYAWDCRPRRSSIPVVVLWFHCPQTLPEDPPREVETAGREWNLALTLDGRLLDHDIEENWPDERNLHLVPR